MCCLFVLLHDSKLLEGDVFSLNASRLCKFNVGVEYSGAVLVQNRSKTYIICWVIPIGTRKSYDTFGGVSIARVSRVASKCMQGLLVFSICRFIGWQSVCLLVRISRAGH
jgi:hypothetical protein